MEIAEMEGELRIGRFTNEGRTILPGMESVLDPASFAFDEGSNRLWFRQYHRMFNHHLWGGKRRGDTLSGVVVYDETSGGLYAPDRQPIGLPTSIDLINAVGVFYYVHE